MELKKSEKASLENKKGMFFQIGLLTVLSLLFVAFEWQSKPEDVSSLGELSEMVIEEEIIPITRPEEIKLPPPPPQQVIEELTIVEDDKEDIKEVEMQNTEADQKTTVAAKIEIENTEEEDMEIVNFYVLENKPEFPGGGEAALVQWIAKSTVYPEIAKENQIQGKVFVGFVIEKDGSVSDVKTLRGVDPYLDKEAIRVVKSMPKWKPGSQRGKPVRVSFQVPIVFRLN
jgi:protein TonB